MLSSKSLIAFIKINGAIWLLGLLKFFGLSDWIIAVLIIHFTNIDKKLLDWEPKEDYKFQFLGYTITNNMLKGITHNLVTPRPTRLITFIPRSFLFELIFDFFHYWIHRISHYRYLYRFHKTHHKYPSPNSWTTFYMHPIDLVLSYSIPFLISSLLVPFNSLEFAVLTVYMAYQEIAGHLGKEIYPSSCFAQCVWLPRALNIELYTEDHHNHHRSNNCNYSKRFIIWDKIFGTFKNGLIKKKVRLLDNNDDLHSR
jgi:sterol desaturase/sphingolipid hydroxylase (fatty acid hydroxylase superfamily)